MNYTLLKNVVSELGNILPGAYIERVMEGDGNSVVLELGAAKNRKHLLLSPDRILPRFHLLSSKPAPQKASHPFTQFLKSRMVPGRVTGICLAGSDRIVKLDLSARQNEYHLYFEVFGRAANMILADKDDVILAVYHQVSLSDRQARPLVPGLHYQLPPRKEQPATGGASGAGFEIASADQTANRAAEIELDRARLALLFHARSTRLRSRIKVSRDRMNRRREALLKDRANADRAEEFKQAGERILANMERLKPGIDRAELAGYDGTQGMVMLDPKLTPARNAESFFKRYKKAKAARTILSTRLAETEHVLTLLTECEARLNNSGTIEELQPIEALLTERGLVRSTVVKKHLARKDQEVASVRRIQFEGWEIVVGKSAAGNDYVSTKLARPEDLWFHAEGLPGSHVVIRNPGHKEVPPAVIDRAAGLAAFYSKGRAAGKVAVTFSLSANVKKPKGAKPGLVTLFRRTTIMAVPSPE